VEHDGLIPLNATATRARKQSTRANSNSALKEQPRQESTTLSAQEDASRSAYLTSPPSPPLGWVVLSPRWLTSQLVGRLVELGENYDASHAHDYDSEDAILDEVEDVEGDDGDEKEGSISEERRSSSGKGDSGGLQSGSGVARVSFRGHFEGMTARHILAKDLMRRALRLLVTARTIDSAHLEKGTTADAAIMESVPISISSIEQSEEALFPRNFGDIEDLMVDLGLAYSDCLPKATYSGSCTGSRGSSDSQSVLVVPSLLASNDSNEPPLSHLRDQSELGEERQEGIMRLCVRAPVLLPGLFPRLCVRLAVLLGPPFALSPWSASFRISNINSSLGGSVTVALGTSNGGVGGLGPLPGVWTGDFVVRSSLKCSTETSLSTMLAADACDALKNGPEHGLNSGNSRSILKSMRRQQQATVLRAVALARAAIDSACYDCPALKLGEWTGKLAEVKVEDFEDHDDVTGAPDDEMVHRGGVSQSSSYTLDENLNGRGANEKLSNDGSGSLDTEGRLSKLRAAEDSVPSLKVVQDRMKALKGENASCVYHRSGFKAQLTVIRVCVWDL